MYSKQKLILSDLVIFFLYDMQWVQLPPELKQGLQKANIVSNQLLTQQLLERQRANVTSYLQLAHLRLSNSLTSQP